MWLAFLFISIPPVLQLWGCAGGTQNDGGFFSSLFGQSPTPTDTPTPTICATPTVTPTPEATESERSHRKVAKPHNPGESATSASPNPTATGSVTLEPSSSAAPPASAARAPSVTLGSDAGSTPLSAIATPGLKGPATANTGSVAESSASDPSQAEKLVNRVDSIEKRVDRRNLNSDDSERDILAQKMLQNAKQALAEHDNVAAMSLASKASTLLAPLPKITSPGTLPTP